MYVLTPDTDDTDALVARVAAAAEGGAVAVQYRHKHASRAKRLQQASALAGMLAARNILFIVNDDPALAAEVGADGVHIGEDDGSPAAARARIGADAIIGVSCYGDLDRAVAAVSAGADYVAFGSFHASATKPAARRADLSLLPRARALRVPVVAVGGIDAANAGALFAAGADAVAVVSAVFASEDPASIRNAAAAIARAASLPIR